MSGFDGTVVLSSMEMFTPGHLDVADEDSSDGDEPALSCEDNKAP